MNVITSFAPTGSVRWRCEALSSFMIHPPQFQWVDCTEKCFCMQLQGQRECVGTKCKKIRHRAIDFPTNLTTDTRPQETKIRRSVNIKIMVRLPRFPSKGRNVEQYLFWLTYFVARIRDFTQFIVASHGTRAQLCLQRHMRRIACYTKVNNVFSDLKKNNTTMV